jgi:hypothetical protein
MHKGMIADKTEIWPAVRIKHTQIMQSFSWFAPVGTDAEPSIVGSFAF